jgi:hypothetical protein
MVLLALNHPVRAARQARHAYNKKERSFYFIPHSRSH